MFCLGKQFLVKVLFWLVAEIILNYLGLDNIADYSEFIFEKNYYKTLNLCQIIQTQI